MKKEKKKKEGKKFSLRKQYKLSWDYVKESKKFIFIIVGIFFAFALIGYFVPASPEVTETIMKFIKELVEKTEGMSQWELVSFIFFNNVQSSFFGLVLGFAFGVFPILAAVANGYLLGFVGAMAAEADGLLSLWRILPHGIFELPAVFISLGMGMKFGSFLFQKKKRQAFVYYLVSGARAFLFIVIPLLVVAGIIEGTLIALSG